MDIPEESYRKWGYLLGMCDELLDMIDQQAAETDDMRDTVNTMRSRIEVYILEEETQLKAEFGGVLDDADEDNEFGGLDRFEFEEDDDWKEDSP